MRQGLKTSVLLTIFGVPVIWYLFLQFFGSNQFELNKVGSISDYCVPEAMAILILDEAGGDEELNQFDRIQTNSLTAPLVAEVPDASCQVEQWDFVLVDKEGDIYGQYMYDIEEVDRLITEVELLQLKKEKEKDAIH